MPRPIGMGFHSILVLRRAVRNFVPNGLSRCCCFASADVENRAKGRAPWQEAHIQSVDSSDDRETQKLLELKTLPASDISRVW